MKQIARRRREILGIWGAVGARNALSETSGGRRAEKNPDFRCKIRSKFDDFFLSSDGEGTGGVS